MEELSKRQRKQLRSNLKQILEQYPFTEIEKLIVEQLNLELMGLLVERIELVNRRTKCIRCNKYFDGIVPMLGHCQSIHKMGEPKQTKSNSFKLAAAKRTRSKSVIFEHKSVRSSLSGVTSSRNWKKTK